MRRIGFIAIGDGAARVIGIGAVHPIALMLELRRPTCPCGFHDFIAVEKEVGIDQPIGFDDTMEFPHLV
jgi:hypothetical protein